MVILNTALISDSLIIDLMSISEFITMDTLIGKYIIIYIFFLYSIKNLDRTMTQKIDGMCQTFQQTCKCRIYRKQLIL